jgi:hypothetical protein
MNSNPPLCPSCGKPVASGQQFCPSCGVRLGSPETRGPGLPPDDSWDTVLEADQPTSDPRAHKRTQTGLLVMIVAFGLLWIPYVSDLGELLVVVGLVYLYLGRFGFTEAHWRRVLAGTGCVVLSLLIGIGAGIWFAGSLLSAAMSPNESLSAIVATIQADLVWLFGVAVVTSILASIGYLTLPYALADPDSRFLLWCAFALNVAVVLFIFFIVEPQISAAIAAATTGGTLNPGPVTALQTREALLGTIYLGPNALFLWAYYRIRERVFEAAAPSGQNPPVPSKFGRID